MSRRAGRSARSRRRILHGGERMNIGLLLLRLVVGLALAAHGSQKLFGWFGGGGLDGLDLAGPGWGLAALSVGLGGGALQLAARRRGVAKSQDQPQGA